MKKILLLIGILGVLFLSGCKPPEPYCGDMGLSEALDLAALKCGSIIGTYHCEGTTWFIDSTIEKKECNIVCGIDTTTKEASFEWSCPKEVII